MASTPIRSSLLGFGKRLKQARSQAGLSGPALAAKVGLERSAIPQYEAGRVAPSMSVLQQLARTLGVTIDWLCFDEYEAKDAIQDKELADFLIKADRLPRRDRTLIKDFVESLLTRDKLERADDKKHHAA